MSKHIAYTKPSVGELEAAYVLDAVKTGWGSRCYDYINRFERAFGEHLGSEFVIATSSCTGAMHMGLSALGVGESSDDEVILADTNWIATVSPIVHLGALPVFADIDPVSWCISPDSVEQLITKKTKAIIATHIYGNMCDMDRLLTIGKKYKIPVVEDSAEAIGSRWRGRHAGTMGLFGVFSFHGTKTVTTGEGGMLVTNDSVLYEDILTLSNHGRSRKQIKQFWPDMIGFKYKISNIQAALGLAQIERIDELIDKKRSILNAYKDNLSKFQGLSFNPEPAHVVNGAWMPTVVFDKNLGVSREMLLQAFQSRNIDARVFFHPLSSLDMFESKPSNECSWDIPGRAINLPSFHDITPNEIERVCNVIKNLIGSIT